MIVRSTMEKPVPICEHWQAYVSDSTGTSQSSSSTRNQNDPSPSTLKAIAQSGSAKFTLSEKWWFVTFIDDYTRLAWVFPISNKFEVTSIFQDFYHTVATQFNFEIAILHGDNSQEFQSHTLHEFRPPKGVFPRVPVHTLLSKMELQNEKTITFWK
ncbi:Beta-galactosidase [Cucumis melo var. makuwa]|uniref:Beta-galactosidase n=1 Tax=Cucumis melo var. makuwa TaxID=1194695 RepID=A0A5A7V251_CUCMM|nr:Beta-galactosidase [Cucumis melo var. makuwa]TYK02303.1 Beta-galactosidase [Cucumis melo var. makuwa]